MNQSGKNGEALAYCLCPKALKDTIYYLMFSTAEMSRFTQCLSLSSRSFIKYQKTGP